MYILNLKVRDKILLPESYESPGFRFVGDNEDYVIHFDVDVPYTAMFAKFHTAKGDPAPILLDKDANVKVPISVMKQGQFDVGIYKDGYATTPFSVWVDGSIINDEDIPLEEPGKSQVEQLIALANRIATVTKAEIDENGELLLTLQAGGEESTVHAGTARGNGILTLEQTTESGKDGGTNEVTVTFTNGETSTFRFLNGTRGNGIQKAEQTETSKESAGVNRFVFTMTDGETATLEVRNGEKGEKGDAAVIESVTAVTGEPGSEASAVNEGTTAKARIRLTIPQGEVGKTPEIAIGTVETVAPDEKAAATVTGTAEKPELNLKIPKGNTGDTPNLSIGTVETVAPEEPASASMTGTAEKPVLNLRIPKGEKGEGAEEIAQGIENFSKDMAGLDTKVSALSHQMAYAVRGYRDMSEYITNKAVDANMDNLVLSEDAVIPEKMYIKYTGTKILNRGSGFNGRTQVREVAFARDISFRQGLPFFDNCTSLEKITFPEGVTALGSFSYTALKRVECDSATNVGSFNHCTQLEQISFPNGMYADGFQYCEKLQQISFPKLKSIATQCFWYSGLKKADFAVLSSIGNLAFWKAPLETLIIRSETLCALADTRALGNTPISSGSGYIYVPSALVDTYKAATNWTAYSAQIRAIEDYPEITGGTV